MLRNTFVILSVAACFAAPPKVVAKKPVTALPYAQRIERIIASSPALERAHLGVRVVDMQGKVVYERNPRSWFIPASNTKLYTTALALSRLGADYRMTTRITSQTPPDLLSGIVNGDIRLVGGGDPSLSGRTYPYLKDEEMPGQIPGIEELADQLARDGITRIEGAIVGDDTAYQWDPFPNGWGLDDPLYEYGAPVSALTLQDNSFRIEIRPGAEPGEMADVILTPDAGQVTLVPSVITVASNAAGRVNIDRPANTNELRVTGTVPIGKRNFTNLYAVADPALYAAQVLQAALERRGIFVRDPARVRHRDGDIDPGPAFETTLAERRSRPLSELVQVINKVSQNLHAELMLREVSRQARPFGSRETGLDDLRAFLKETVGLTADDFNFEDGSGLSRLTLTTPEATTRLLVHMAGQELLRSYWFESLPIGGEDGTLGKRFNGFSGAKRITAKTGTLTHVSALGGYLDHPTRGRLAFTVLLNNYNTPSAEARKALDELVAALLQ